MRIKITTIQIFEAFSCCSADTCGTETDQEQAGFPANVEWAKQQGATIKHFSLSQQPAAFEDNATTKAFLKRSGVDALPLFSLMAKSHWLVVIQVAMSLHAGLILHRKKTKNQVVAAVVASVNSST